MVSQYTQFKGVTSIGDTMLMDELENNLKTYLDWGLLQIGGFINVRRPTVSTADGGNFHILRPSSDPAYTAGTVYETIRKDWVWETGVSYSGTSPIQISGVYVDNVLYPSTGVAYGHYYDYQNGRVIFSSGVPSNSVVSLEYSYRLVQVYKSEDASWFFEGQYQSFRPANDQWDTYSPSSGDYATPPQQRAQFPSVVVEAAARSRNTGWELGSKTLNVEQDVLFHIVADRKKFRSNLIDILRFEHDHIIKLYDTDAVVRAGLAPLDYRGMLVNTTGMYPYIVDNYLFTTTMFRDVRSSEVESLNPYLHEAQVRVTMELIIGQV